MRASGPALVYDVFWVAGVLGVAGLVLGLMVNMRQKMLNDLAIVEKVRHLGIDAKGTVQAFALGSFSLNFRLTYGWMVLMPKLMLGLAGALMLVAAVGLGAGAALLDWSLLTGGFFALGIGNIFVLIALEFLKEPAMPQFQRLFGGKIKLLTREEEE